MRLRARDYGCEEAHPSSGEFYVPCNKSALVLIRTKDTYVYRMCMSCADHNLRNRGAKSEGPYSRRSQRHLNGGKEDIE